MQSLQKRHQGSSSPSNEDVGIGIALNSHLFNKQCQEQREENLINQIRRHNGFSTTRHSEIIKFYFIKKLYEETYQEIRKKNKYNSF